MKIPANHATRPPTPTSENDNRPTTAGEGSHATLHAQTTPPATGQRNAPRQSAQRLALLNEIREVQPKATRSKRVAFAPDVSIQTIDRVLGDDKKSRKYPATRTRGLVDPVRTAVTAVETSNQQAPAPQAVRSPVSSRTPVAQTAATAGRTDTQPIAPVRRPSI
ncbi:MAG: hypothetical protein ACI8WM_003403 [Burkholderiaceae bacterium]|jgi:hypothetical protein